jgi:hypothetical protein
MHRVPPSVWVALRNQGLDNNSLRGIAKIMPCTDIFESCANSEITPEEAADIMMMQRESDYWIVRFLDSILC